MDIKVEADVKPKKPWNMEKSKLFVEEYLKHHCLWNTDSTKYRSKVEKTVAYQKLASDFELTIEEVKTKIRSLRTTYKQEQNKIISIENYKPRLSWFHSMAGTFNEGKVK
jgi:hypothetical protein